MNIKLKIVFCFIVITACTALTVSAGSPRYYSPFSLTTVLPIFLVYTSGISGVALSFIAAIPNAFVFLISTLSLTEQDSKLTKPFTIFCAITILLSIAFFVVSFSYGVTYQGLSHTVLMCIFSSIFIAAIFAAFKLNNQNPNINNALAFRVLFFSWVGWVSFPWLGEMI